VIHLNIPMRMCTFSLKIFEQNIIAVTITIRALHPCWIYASWLLCRPISAT